MGAITDQSRRLRVLACIALAVVSVACLAAFSPAVAQAERMPLSYAKKKIRSYINQS